MSDPAGMLDVHFELTGERLLAGCHEALWVALCGRLPWLADEPLAGMHFLRGALGVSEVLLSHRSRLILRLPEARYADVQVLSRCEVVVDGSPLLIGCSRQVPLEPYSTLHAHVVLGDSSDEAAFMSAMAREMESYGLQGRLICGKRQTLLVGGESITGFSLVAYDLNPEAALRLQQLGLGRFRKYGCGVFVPYKEISGIQ